MEGGRKSCGSIAFGQLESRDEEASKWWEKNRGDDFDYDDSDSAVLGVQNLIRFTVSADLLSA